MKKLFKKLKGYIISITKYIYTNRLFLTYVILALCGSVILREVTINRDFSIKPLITDLGLILLIGAIGYFVKPRSQFKYFFTWLIIFTIIEVVNSIYFTFYESFASFSEFSTLSQTETVANSIFAQLKLVNFIFLLQPIIFYYVHNSLKKSSYYNYIDKIEKKSFMFVTTLIASLICLIYTFATAASYDFSRLNKQWDRSYIVERFGIIMYQFNDLFLTVKPKINSLFGYEEAYKMFTDYFAREDIHKYDGDNKYTGILKGYNIVYIHMESMQNFLMNLSFNGVDVTPNLNNLAKEGMFFSNFYPQISTGTSSDAEYITLTGLLPASTGIIFTNYANNEFVTIPKRLKEQGYYTFSMHGNLPAMWNRKTVHPKLGYDDMYFHDSFVFQDSKNSPDVVGLGINDKLFFKQAIEKLETIESTYENYFGTLITLSNHSPFDFNKAFTLDINDYYTNETTGEIESTCYLCKRDVGKYIVSSHYADEALGDFINYIKESDYFDNTIFVFYGDHDAKLNYKDMNYLYNYDYLTGELKDESDPSYIEYDSFDHQLNKKTPLIMWTKNKNLSKILHGEIKTLMGMYDLAPTLYNMLDMDKGYVLGHDIFNIKNDNIVIFPTGNFLTNKVYYNNSTGKYKNFDKDELDGDYILEKKAYAEEVLEISNTIVSYNLFSERNNNNS